MAKSRCRFAIASMSLGRAGVGHELDTKLSAAAAAGIVGIEVFFEDLSYLAQSRTQPGHQPDLLSAAAEFKRICQLHHLEIISLQPFMHYEGLLDLDQRHQMLDKAKTWFKLANILGTDIIQVPSNFLQEGITGDPKRLVADLLMLSELAATEAPNIRLAYEGICWGTFVNTWTQVHDIVSAVDRPNFGICLDTFHLLGAEWADPGAPCGRRSGNDDETFRKSMQEMAQTLDPSKIFYVQLSNGAEPQRPIVPGDELWVDGQPSRMTWSRRMRTFPYEAEGYMPLSEVLDVIFLPSPHGLNYQGWVSMEVFADSLTEKDAHVPTEHAARASRAWSRLRSDYHLA